jgi:putative ABC transport system substrate-binding protein
MRDLQRAALRAVGYVDGKNLRIDYRFGETADELLNQAKELVRLKVQLIVTEGTAPALAAKKATSVMPIVMWSAGDPVRSGLVASLAKPGGNVTGLSIVSPELDAKRLSLLRELLPSTVRVGELEISINPYYRAARGDLEETYRRLDMQPIFVKVSRADEIEGAIAEVVRQRGTALHVPREILFINNGSAIMQSAVRHALPTIVDGSELLEAGGLIAYDYDPPELLRVAATFVDRVLRGAKPADLPIAQPTKFEAGINVKTAKALGITLPKTVLLLADRVIQ